MKAKCHEKREECMSGLCRECYHHYIYLRKLVLNNKDIIELDKSRLLHVKNEIKKAINNVEANIEPIKPYIVANILTEIRDLIREVER